MKHFLFSILLALPLYAQTPISFYVSSGVGPNVPAGVTAGSDSNNGTSITTPFLTLTHAAAAVATLVNGNCGTITNPVIVDVRGGEYLEASTLTLVGSTSVYPSTAGLGNNGCSTTHPVIWQSHPGELATITAGTRLTGWVTTANTCTSCTQYSVSYSGPYIENLWYTQQTSSYQWTKDSIKFYLAQRRLRPRLGATSGNNFQTYYTQSNGGSPTNAIVLTTDACNLPATENGVATGCTGPSGANTNCANDGSGNCTDRLHYNTGSPIDTWGNIRFASLPKCDIEIYVWENWTVSKERLCAVDTTNQIIVFAGPMGISGTYSPTGNFGPLNGHRYMIENICGSGSLPTLPQQWCWDRNTNLIYYNAAAGENPNTDFVEIPSLTHPLIEYNLSWVTFRGMQFEMDNGFTVPNTGYNSVQSEPKIPAAVEVQNSFNVTFESDIFSNTSSDGMELIRCQANPSDGTQCFAYSAPTSTAELNGPYYIAHNAFLDIGSNGLQPGNKTLGATDTDGNIPQQVTVSDNLFDGMNRVFPSAFSISGGSTAHNFIQYNEIYDTYHAGIAICTPPCTVNSGQHGVQNINAFFNLLHNITQAVVDDIGALYYTTISPPNLANAQAYTTPRIWWNYIHDINDPNALPGGDVGGQGGNGIYGDQGEGNLDARYNIVVRTSAYCFKYTSGIGFGSQAFTANLMQNNICAYNRLGVLATGVPTLWVNQTDFTPTACPAANQRLHFSFINNLVYGDRINSDSPSYYMQNGCADSCGFTYTKVFNYQLNDYFNTNMTIATNAHAFHVATNIELQQSTANCSASNSTGWSFINGNGWTTNQLGTAYSPNLGTGVAGSVTGALEDVGSVFDTNPNFTNPGFTAGDNYNLASCATLPSGFSCTQTNLTFSTAGRFTNTGFLPTIIQTFPTGTGTNGGFDPTTSARNY